MLYQRFIVRYDGGWDIYEYVGGDEELMSLSHERVSCTHLLFKIYDAV